MSEPVAVGRLADGEWHRLHPATPLLRGGFAFVAVIGIIIVNLRDVGLEILLGAQQSEDDPFTWIIEHEFAGWVLLAILAGLILFVVGFYVSWRMHTFRITNEQVEVRSGILFRTNRRGRLDRIQGINIVRPFLARLVGAAKLEINVAGQDANVQLAYLGSGAADELRREILLLASGTSAGASTAPTGGAGFVEQRVSELLAPELDPNAVAPESVVQMNLGRLIGSIVLSGFTVFLVVGIIVGSVVISQTGDWFFFLGVVPAVIGIGSFYITRFTRSLRYSIAGTPDGIRVGFGLLSTSNETLPPGRIHAVHVSQPLLWRPAGWWEIKINRAASSSSKGAAGQANTTILPVGNLADVLKVLALVLPSDALPPQFTSGLISKGGDDFVNSPPRARVFRWFSWRRNGFALTPDFVIFRRGIVWRELTIVPHARLQSIELHQGPLARALRLAGVRVHTVRGPVLPRIGAIDHHAAIELFGSLADAATLASRTDTSHRWREK